jgi:anaerobic selenocysteine-containing dehydrogenase/Fe-S-cluster-containing dehydrogenase component
MPELDRRDFLKLVGASAGAAATAGCSDPVEKLIPYVIQPQEITPGIAVLYASTCRECSAGCGLHVRTREARPIKLEGNPDHPINRGVLCGKGQAAIARTYHPDRYPGAMVRGGGALAKAGWEDALGRLGARLQELRAAGKVGALRVLGSDPGPTAGALLDRWISALGGDPAKQRLIYEPFSHEALRAAAGAVFGVETLPVFDVSGADLVLDFGSDFLATGLSPVEQGRQFAEAQDITAHPDGGAHLVAISPRLTLTASNADEWIPAAPGSEGLVALVLAKALFERAQREGRSVPGDAAAVAKVLARVDAGEVERLAGIEREKLAALRERVLAARSLVALPPGVASTSRRATSDAAAVLLLDALAGASASGALRLPVQEAARPAGFQSILGLVEDMKAGRVEVLLVHDADPLYSLPADSGFAEALEKVGTVVSFSSLADETSERAAHLVLPDHTPLESWGAAAPRPGVRSLLQPTVRPLLDTQALGDTLLALGRGLGEDVAAKLPAGSFKTVLEQAWSGTPFRQAVSRGGVFAEDPAGWASLRIASSVQRLSFREPELEGEGDFTLVAFPHSFLGDGRSAALPFAQEVPDPVTKISWQSWAEISRDTAARLGVDFGDVVAIETGFGAGRIEVPVYPRGGIRHDVVAIAIGQGHTVGYHASLAVDGRPGEARGASVISVLPARTDESGGRAWLTTRASLRPTGGYKRLPLSQWTDNQRKRGLAPQVSLVALAEGKSLSDATGEGGAAEHGDLSGEVEHPSGHEREFPPFAHGRQGLALPYDRANDAEPESPYRWAMTIDNDRCTGCSACIAACAIENNIPSVGEDGMARHREMLWLRIERYIGDGEVEGGRSRRPYPDREKLGDNDVRHVPMLCQHCGAAPCESVCPVIATYHTPEGLNGMIYNRCVGTRYCANNCTYKVRRFNYFDYSQERWPGMLGLMTNPDLTVRQQGVMEKCTFCVQRIEHARQTAKDEGRPIRDGEVTTACQQSCPTQAITFGNAREPTSQVVQKADRAEPRSYVSLPTLNTRPAITYLAQVDREPSERSRG